MWVMTVESQRNTLPSTLFQMSKAKTGGSVVILPDFWGSVLYAQPLVRELAAEASFYGVRLAPDMVDNRQNHTMISLSKRFAADIIEADLPQPVRVCGFSFAGLLAFETARCLARTPGRQDGLFILDSRIKHPNLIRWALSLLKNELKYYKNNWRRIIAGEPESLILHRYGQIRIDLTEYSEAYRTIVRQLYRAMASYRPRKWKGSAVLFRALEDDWDARTPDLEWSKLIMGKLEVVDVPGNHLGMLRNPENAAVLADQMRAYLSSNNKRDFL